LNSIVEALRHTPRDTQLDVATLNDCSDYWETVRTYYLPFDSGPKAGSARLYQHEIPGGQFTNLREQAAAMGLGHRWREGEKMYAEVNQLFGDIVKVTPSSKVVGDMTLFLMAKEMQPADVLALDEKHDVSFPNSVVELFSGVLGVPPGGWPKKLQKIILRGQPPLRGRPSATLESVKFEEGQISLQKKLSHAVLRDVHGLHPRAATADAGQVAAPAAGVISGIAVQTSRAVERGAKLLAIEAMKMQSNIAAPISGRIVKILVTCGQHVEAKDLLVA